MARRCVVPAVLSATGLLLPACTAPTTTVAPSVSPYAVIDGERVPVPPIPMGDPATIEAIIAEGQQNPRVMDHLAALTLDMGPRLTGSTNLERAQAWAIDRFESWGLENVRNEPWGTLATRFDRGPSSANLYFGPGDDRERPIDGFTTLAWSSGTDGPVRGPAMLMPTTEDEYEANKGRYAGAWVLHPVDHSGRAGIRGVGFLMRQRLDEYKLIRAGGDISPTGVNRPLDEGDRRYKGLFEFAGGSVDIVLDLRYDEEGRVTGGFMEIPGSSRGDIRAIDHDPQTGVMSFEWPNGRELTTVKVTLTDGEVRGEGVNTLRENSGPITLDRIPDEDIRREAGPSLLKRVMSENPAGFVSSSKDRRVWTTSANDWSETRVEDYGPDVEVNINGPDDDFIRARLAEGVPIELEFDLQNNLTPGPITMTNTIAEIPGTEKPDEVVIMSAHIDSWDGPGSQGTVDNGTGTAVTLEAARILAAVGARPKRTIRFILWTGEEQGLLGARAYVDQLSSEERANISALFNDDGGTNYQGGAAGITAMVPYLAAATAPTNGRFTSEHDRIAHLRDDDPSNDETAGRLNVNITTLDAGRLPRGGGSDHAAFNAVGIPGFFWNETGRARYRDAWHTQFDTFDQAIPEYLIQSAVNTAVTLYNMANAPALLPRTNDGGSEDADAAAAGE